MSELTCVEINKISVYVNARTTTFAFDHNHDWLQEALHHKVLSEESFRKVCRPFQVDFLINIIVTIKEKSHGQFLQKYHWSWFEMIASYKRTSLLEDDCLLLENKKERATLWAFWYEFSFWLVLLINLWWE